MEKRLLGIILTILGVIGLIMAGYYFMNSGHGAHPMKSLALFGILGIVFFIAGIGLIKNTSDKPT